MVLQINRFTAYTLSRRMKIETLILVGTIRPEEISIKRFPQEQSTLVIIDK
jgi:hypothetical protein